MIGRARPDIAGGGRALNGALRKRAAADRAARDIPVRPESIAAKARMDAAHAVVVELRQCILKGGPGQAPQGTAIYGRVVKGYLAGA